jgi:hypothetical protein
MHFYHVALYILLVNVSLSLVNAIPVDGLATNADMGYEMVGVSDWNVTADYDELNPGNLDQGDNMISSLQNIWAGMTTFIAALFNATVAVPLLLGSLGLPAAFVAIFTAGVWFVYGAGLIELWSGRTVSG